MEEHTWLHSKTQRQCSACWALATNLGTRSPGPVGLETSSSYRQSHPGLGLLCHPTLADLLLFSPPLREPSGMTGGR